jgi:hypothetical protein
MVALVCHDAGGAEILSSWAKLQSEEYCRVTEGPATNIFDRKLGIGESLELEQAIQKSDWLLCGTSWQSDLEKRAVTLCKQSGKKVISFIDHWVNYPERFIIDGRLVLPDEIWVGDVDAEKIAENSFPDTPIVLQNNPYFIELKALLENISRTQTENDLKTILYVCEPFRDYALLQYGDEHYLGYTEEQALNFFLENVAVLGVKVKEIQVRPHPSEESSKYFWCTANQNYNVVIGGKKTLLEEIVAADIIVGCESMAMVVALLDCKRVISCIPRGGKACGLPQKSIEHLQNLVKDIE